MLYLLIIISPLIYNRIKVKKSTSPERKVIHHNNRNIPETHFYFYKEYFPCNFKRPFTTNRIETYTENMDKEKEFTDLLMQHQHIIYKICLMYADEKEDIADLYQETVYNLWKSYTRFENRSSFSTWVYRITLNTCITDIRQRKRKGTTCPLDLTTLSLWDERDPKQEMLKEMYRMIRGLNKLERMYIMLWLDGKTYEEIAEIIGTSRNQVATTLHRIKEKLKNKANL